MQFLTVETMIISHIRFVVSSVFFCLHVKISHRDVKWKYPSIYAPPSHSWDQTWLAVVSCAEVIDVISVLPHHPLWCVTSSLSCMSMSSRWESFVWLVEETSTHPSCVSGPLFILRLEPPLLQKAPAKHWKMCLDFPFPSISYFILNPTRQCVTA